MRGKIVHCNFNQIVAHEFANLSFMSAMEMIGKYPIYYQYECKHCISEREAL